MLYEEIKKSMILAMKAKDIIAKDIYSLLLSNLKNKAIEKRVEILSDEDCIQVIRKLVKNLDEEIELYAKAARAEKAADLEMQRALIKKFLPQMLAEDEIKAIIATIEDKSMKGIMTYFKVNYPGRVDMSLVSKLAKG